MDEMHAALDRLEARIDHQGARIDALYEMLELRGVIPRNISTLKSDSWYGSDPEARDLYSVWKRKSPPTRRPKRIHVGDATGV